MAKAKRVVTYCKVTPIGRRRLDPYNNVFVQLGDPYVLDSAKAQMLADLGEVEILEENITPPWAVKPEPAPAPAPVKEKIIEKETEVKAKA